MIDEGDISPKPRLVVLLLCLLFGVFGVLAVRRRK